MQNSQPVADQRRADATRFLADEKSQRVFASVLQGLSVTAEEVALRTEINIEEAIQLLDGLAGEFLVRRDDPNGSGGLPLYSPTAIGIGAYREVK